MFVKSVVSWSPSSKVVAVVAVVDVVAVVAVVAVVDVVAVAELLLTEILLELPFCI